MRTIGAFIKRSNLIYWVEKKRITEFFVISFYLDSAKLVFIFSKGEVRPPRTARKAPTFKKKFE